MSVYGEKELKEEQEEFESKKAGFANACRDKVKTRNDCIRRRLIFLDVQKRRLDETQSI